MKSRTAYRQGGDVNSKSALLNQTPLDVAIHPDKSNHTDETVDLLRKHGGKTSEELKTEGK